MGTMKCIPFKSVNQKGSIYVTHLQRVKEELIILGVTEPVEVSWANDGKYKEIWLEAKHAVCPYCGTANSLSPEDMGFEEFECGYCEGTYTIPETTAELPAYNLDNMKASTSGPPPSHYRIMCHGEDGMEFCLKNGVPAEYAELVCAGLQTHYTEGQRCFLEPEETLADLRRMCDSDDDY